MNARDSYVFASDNAAGICPAALQSLIAANQDCVGSYGGDPWTERAKSLIDDFFECACEVFFTFNGTAANSLAISALCQRHHSIIAHRQSHLQTDECGCPEFMTGGTKILLANGDQGRIDVDHAAELAAYRRDVHFPPVRAIGVTQATEWGTVYDLQHLDRLHELKQRFQLHIHMDGARFANAVASLGVAPKACTWQAGIDCLSLGGTKNGMAVGECVVFFNKSLASEFGFRIKQAGQLASKMRFLSAPWVGMLESGDYLRHARHANAMASQLKGRLQAMGLRVINEVQANGVLVDLGETLADQMRELGWHFYDLFNPGESRLMCSWATAQQDLDAFLDDLQQICQPELNQARM